MTCNLNTFFPLCLYESVSHPQRVVDGVLLLVLGDHQGEGVRPRAGQPYLGQVVGAVDADAVDVRRGVGCGRSEVRWISGGRFVTKCFRGSYIEYWSIGGYWGSF